MFRIIFTICALVIAQSESARILAVFPVPSISHQVVFRPLTQELAKRGHEVVVITTDPAFPKGKTPANLTEIDVHDVTYAFWRSNYVGTVDGKTWKSDPISLIKQAYELFAKVFDVQLEDKEVKRIIKEDSFDLVIVESGCRPAYVLSHIFKAPMILISSAGASSGTYDIIGAPTHPILYPMLIRQRIYNLTSWEKIQELYRHFWFKRNLYLVDETVNMILQKHFGPTVPTIDELRNNVDMLFLNMHPIFEGNQPVPPSVVHVWGLHQKLEKDLPDDLKSFLDNSKNGVIYMSFGTNVSPSMLPKEKVEIIINVLSQLPYDVLWKWDEDANIQKPENIRIGKWFPQSDLLRHPKLKLFITQGGLQSTDEAIHAGVPLIGIPIAADQWYNTEKYVHLKIGVQLDLETMSEDDFKNAVTQVIVDDGFRKNTVKLRSLMRDEPLSGLQRAVWWSEHALRHGGARHLRAPAANISWADYLELRLLAVLFGGLFAALLVILVTIYSIFKFFTRSHGKFKLN